MKAAPEQYRLKDFSDSSYGNNGAFRIPHNRIENYYYQCIISNGAGWEHVSITLGSTKRKVERCPTWGEMCYAKDLFFDKNEVVVQFHPAEVDYISNHEYCLHLWKPIDIDLPTPDPIMVGINNNSK